MNVLVTGGAGYVGSIVAEELWKAGHRVVAIDNLKQGHKQAILPGIEPVFVDIQDTIILDSVLKKYQIDAVMHLAAETLVEFSMTDPRRYFNNNTVLGLSLLNIMLENNVSKMILSSTAAVYGEPNYIPIDEEHPTIPTNSYGESKLMFERILDWYGKAYGLKHISLRYFNAAGASGSLGEDHRPETHLIPNIIKAALYQDKPVTIFGSDYPTKDGSCIRDYIHISDIAQAHILALNQINEKSGRVYNLGNEEGYSVIDVLQIAKRVTGVDIPYEMHPRRSGDPAVLVASSKQAKLELGWEPRYPSLEVIIDSAWQWLQQHPDGYEQ